MWNIGWEVNLSLIDSFVFSLSWLMNEDLVVMANNIQQTSEQSRIVLFWNVVQLLHSVGPLLSFDQRPATLELVGVHFGWK